MTTIWAVRPFFSSLACMAFAMRYCILFIPILASLCSRIMAFQTRSPDTWARFRIWWHRLRCRYAVSSLRTMVRRAMKLSLSLLLRVLLRRIRVFWPWVWSQRRSRETLTTRRCLTSCSTHLSFSASSWRQATPWWPLCKRRLPANTLLIKICRQSSLVA